MVVDLLFCDLEIGMDDDDDVEYQGETCSPMTEMFGKFRRGIQGKWESELEGASRKMCSPFPPGDRQGTT